MLKDDESFAGQLTIVIGMQTDYNYKHIIAVYFSDYC